VRYLLLIYNTESPTTEPQASPETTAAYNAFTRDLQERGILEAGEALHPTSAATTVRVRDGETIATDGPFAETKEALGGFYLLKARDLDEAIELAARIPASRTGSVEIRPIWEFAPGEMGYPEEAGVAR
jgi:hypothetical protein